MYVCVKDIRSVIRRALLREFSGGSARSGFTMGIMPADLANSEQLSSLGDKAKKDEELAPHLTDAMADIEDDFGPVPPEHEDTFYAVLDPFVDDWGVTRLKKYD